MKDAITLLKESGALLEGHFVLTSGRHSNRYFQCARLLQYPDRAAQALEGVAEQLKAAIAAGKIAVDAVVGPAIGGIVVAYELARQLGLPGFFTERDDTGAMALRRGFAVERGMRILIAEDVVTTGKSSGESAAVLEALGATVSALACVVDRRAPGQSVPWPVYAACAVEAGNWEQQDCEICKQGIPAVKPGSRKSQ